MHTNGHTVWGMPIGMGRNRDAKSWDEQIKEWWTARHEARLTTFKARWNATREAVRPFNADAAIDMVASTHAYSATTALCDLGV